MLQYISSLERLCGGAPLRRRLTPSAHDDLPVRTFIAHGIPTPNKTGNQGGGGRQAPGRVSPFGRGGRMVAALLAFGDGDRADEQAQERLPETQRVTGDTHPAPDLLRGDGRLLRPGGLAGQTVSAFWARPARVEQPRNRLSCGFSTLVRHPTAHPRFDLPRRPSSYWQNWRKPLWRGAHFRRRQGRDSLCRNPDTPLVTRARRLNDLSKRAWRGGSREPRHRLVIAVKF